MQGVLTIRLTYQYGADPEKDAIETASQISYEGLFYSLPGDEEMIKRVTMDRWELLRLYLNRKGVLHKYDDQ